MRSARESRIPKSTSQKSRAKLIEPKFEVTPRSPRVVFLLREENDALKLQVRALKEDSEDAVERLTTEMTQMKLQHVEDIVVLNEKHQVLEQRNTLLKQNISEECQHSKELQQKMEELKTGRFEDRIQILKLSCQLNRAEDEIRRFRNALERLPASGDEGKVTAVQSENNAGLIELLQSNINRNMALWQHLNDAIQKVDIPLTETYLLVENSSP